MFLGKCQFCRRLYHFPFLLVLCTSSSFSASLITPWGQSCILAMQEGIVGAWVWICSSLMINDDEHFVMGLFKIHVSSLVKFLFNHFAHFLLCCFHTEFWELFIYCGYQSFISESFADIPSQSVACLCFLSWLCFWWAEVLILMKQKLLHRVLGDCMFLLVLKKYLLNLRSWRFYPRNLWFYVLH